MAVHHYIATGPDSEALRRAARDATQLTAVVADLIAASGLTVMADKAVAFPGGGLTIAWILAESHLVLHHWRDEGYATLDLHVCDYRASNLEKARRLAAELEKLCYAPGGGEWRRVVIGEPLDGSIPAVETPR